MSTATTCPACGYPMTTIGERLPKATNLRIIYIGRNVFSIEGVPGIYERKKRGIYDTREGVKALECIGKGNKWHLFYRCEDLENRLRAALGVVEPVTPTGPAER